MPWWVDNLKLFIEKALKNYKFLNKISEEKFNNKIDDFFDNDV
jgi:hypothetical protein